MVTSHLYRPASDNLREAKERVLELVPTCILSGAIVLSPLVC